MWRSVGLAFLLPTFGFSQDPPQPDRDALYKELLEKVGASGPFTAKLAFESVDEKGVASIRYKASIHMRMKEGWIYLEFHEVGKEEQTGCSVFDGNRFIQVWAKDGVSGVRSDVRSTSGCAAASPSRTPTATTATSGTRRALSGRAGTPSASRTPVARFETARNAPSGTRTRSASRAPFGVRNWSETSSTDC